MKKKAMKKKAMKKKANIQLIKEASNKCKLNPDADVYVIGVQKASKMSVSDFASIGTVIVDESHISSVATFSKALLLFRPRYLIGLSATPDRTDGLHNLLNLYFGRTNDFLVRKEIKEFTVYKVNTQFKPELSYTIVKGRVAPNWNAIINSIEENPERHKLIANIAMKHKNEKIIILCNRKILSEGIFNILKDQNESVDILIGNSRTHDQSKRILVAGFKKCGTGFNDPNLTMAIIASDTKDCRQYEGRIRKTNNIIYHIVDDYQSFESHWKLCEKWYKSKGAVIRSIGKNNNTEKKNQEEISYNFL